jgi:hypothetical protein
LTQKHQLGYLTNLAGGLKKELVSQIKQGVKMEFFLTLPLAIKVTLCLSVVVLGILSVSAGATLVVTGIGLAAAAWPVTVTIALGGLFVITLSY